MPAVRLAGRLGQRGSQRSSSSLHRGESTQGISAALVSRRRVSLQYPAGWDTVHDSAAVGDLQHYWGVAMPSVVATLASALLESDRNSCCCRPAGAALVAAAADHRVALLGQLCHRGAAGPIA